jgi:hypothetical protein
VTYASKMREIPDSDKHSFLLLTVQQYGPAVWLSHSVFCAKLEPKYRSVAMILLFQKPGRSFGKNKHVS